MYIYLILIYKPTPVQSDVHAFYYSFEFISVLNCFAFYLHQYQVFKEERIFKYTDYLDMLINSEIFAVHNYFRRFGKT